MMHVHVFNVGFCFFVSVSSLENYGAGKPTDLAGSLSPLSANVPIVAFSISLYNFLLEGLALVLLQPMLQELGKQNPHLMRLIQEHQADFLRLINEPSEGGEYVSYWYYLLTFL